MQQVKAGDKIPLIECRNKFPQEIREQNIDTALSCGFPDIHSLIGRLWGDAVIIGGGPSADGQIDNILKLIESGANVFAIERMYPWCLDNNIIPNYVIALDASEDVTEGFGAIYPGVTNLVAVQCHPSVFEALKNTRTYIFNTPQTGIPLAKFWDQHSYQRMTLINAGGSVTICAMAMAMAFGCRRLHVFGFDCHINESSYAEGIVGVGAIGQRIEVKIGERFFLTTLPYIAFAQQFFLTMDMGKQQGFLEDVKVYGDSLVVAMSVQDISGGA